jgi:hypothetical protein
LSQVHHLQHEGIAEQSAIFLLEYPYPVCYSHKDTAYFAKGKKNSIFHKFLKPDCRDEKK